MIVYKLMKDLNEDEIFRCIRLINANFKNNRFNTYSSVIYYVIGSDIIGFIGINDNYLNQICTNVNYRNRGIASKMISRAKEELGAEPIYLFVDKNKSTTEYLVNFYKKHEFDIEYENDVEYKLGYKN
uniref:N-acetyltransferase domain-containing protein n=1 Tax=viral metagenome TaxID=1070528 RepID=A0A6C0LA65_9ZZZZ